LLRIGAVRWAVAEAIPLGCIFIGMLLLHEPVTVAGHIVGFLLALMGGTVFTVYYLYKVVGSSGGWTIPLILLNLPATYLGAMIFEDDPVTNAQNPEITPLIITGTYWLAWGCLLGAIAIVVVLAVVNGERWMKRNPATKRLTRGSRAP
jgi:hypothetical protein